MFLNAIFFLVMLKLSSNVSAINIKYEKYMVAHTQHMLSPKHEAQVQC